MYHPIKKSHHHHHIIHLEKNMTFIQDRRDLRIDGNNNLRKTVLQCSSSKDFSITINNLGTPSTIDRAAEGNTHNFKWDKMFSKLVQYMKHNGNTLVPQRYPKLGKWVGAQRRYYKARKAGEDTPLSDERVRKLCEINFVWATKDPRHIPWDFRYKELLQYKKFHGDCRVPIRYEENVKLGNWVSTQRQNFRKWKAGNFSRLTTERIKLLEDIDFTWEAPRGGVRRSKISPPREQAIDEDFDSKLVNYEHSKRYKSPFVPTPSREFAEKALTMKQSLTYDNKKLEKKHYDTAFKERAMNQRHQYAMSTSNSKGFSVTQRRMNLLSSINLEFEEVKEEHAVDNVLSEVRDISEIRRIMNDRKEDYRETSIVANALISLRKAYE